MPKLVERNELAALILIPAGGNLFQVPALRLFFQLLDHGARGAVLHGVGQLAEPMNGFFKQFGHGPMIAREPGYRSIDNFPKTFRKTDIVRS